MGESRHSGGIRGWPAWLKLLVGRPLIAIVIAAVAVGWIVLHGEKQSTPVTHRTQRVALSDAQQTQLGAREYRKTLREDRAEVVHSGPAYRRVQRVAARITAVAARDKPDFRWQATLIRSNQVNAYCLPGGKIVVYTSLLPVAKTDAGLATVLGHEVAHATAEHGAERLEQQRATRAAIAILAGGVAFTPGQYVRVMALLGAGAQVGVSLPWSRKQESEADHIGLVYMARAGYKPSAALAFWQRMKAAAKGKDQTPPLLRDHPDDGTRIKQIRGWLPEAWRNYHPST